MIRSPRGVIANIVDHAIIVSSSSRRAITFAFRLKPFDNV